MEDFHWSSIFSTVRRDALCLGGPGDYKQQSRSAADNRINARMCSHPKYHAGNANRRASRGGKQRCEALQRTTRSEGSGKGRGYVDHSVRVRSHLLYAVLPRSDLFGSKASHQEGKTRCSSLACFRLPVGSLNSGTPVRDNRTLTVAARGSGRNLSVRYRRLKLQRKRANDDSQV